MDKKECSLCGGIVKKLYKLGIDYPLLKKGSKVCKYCYNSTSHIFHSTDDRARLMIHLNYMLNILEQNIIQTIQNSGKERNNG